MQFGHPLCSSERKVPTVWVLFHYNEDSFGLSRGRSHISILGNYEQKGIAKTRLIMIMHLPFCYFKLFHWHAFKFTFHSKILHNLSN